VKTRALARFLLRGTLGAGESYMDGDWECDALDELTAKLLRSHLEDRIPSPMSRAAEAMARFANPQTPARAKKSGSEHYERGNDLYQAMLGRTMAYSCGYWRDAVTLDEAQDAKHDLICRKLYLRDGHRVLDVGCGFGGFAKFAAERYGACVVGVTVSEVQAELARKLCAGLPVEIVVADYRDVAGTFDRIVSVGMFEHVGPLNYPRYFAALQQLLSDDGLALLHTIGTMKPSWRTDPWIHRYIFPNAVLPAASQLTRAAERHFHIEDWHNFGADYDKTLMAWAQNFDAAWPTLAARYDDRFRRMWRYYLLTCAGMFRARRNEVWQLILSKAGVDGGYRRVS
jgi:cyclopropane-fatty-acyl-phospholipid synthase